MLYTLTNNIKSTNYDALLPCTHPQEDHVVSMFISNLLWAVNGTQTVDEDYQVSACQFAQRCNVHEAARRSSATRASAKIQLAISVTMPRWRTRHSEQRFQIAYNGVPVKTYGR